MPGIDTREKRAGAISAGIPFIVISPIADASIDQADRQQIIDVYPGILAGAPSEVTAEVRLGMMLMELMEWMKLMPY